jgi:hypothetical protein
MRQVSTDFSNALAAGELAVRLLITITLRNGEILRFTPGVTNIVWDADSNTYTAFPMEGQPIEYKANFEEDRLLLKFPGLEGELAEAAEKNLLDGAKIKVVRIIKGSTYAADDEIVLFDGLLEIEEEGKEITVECIPLEDSFNIQYPQYTWQEACNYDVFDSKCGLTQSDFAYSGTATSGSTTTLLDTTRGTTYKIEFDGGDEDNPLAIGDTITGGVASGTAKIVQVVYVTASTGYLWYVEQSGTQFVDNEVLSSGGNSVTVKGTPEEDTHFYEQGEMEITGGDNDGQRKMIFIASTNEITILSPFPYAIEAGDTYKIYPGCDGQWETCKNKFGNLPNFFGFPGIPKSEEVTF